MSLINPFEFPLDMYQVEKALHFARVAHKGQKRWDESPYINHLMSVASRCIKHGYLSTNVIITSLLHDIVEDTSISLTAVSDVFGDEIALNVDYLSQRPNESRHDYFTRCMASKKYEVLAVKFSDRCDNVAGLHTCPDLPEYEGHVSRYMQELKDYFVPNLNRVNETLADELLHLMGRAEHYYTGKA
jgi:(p)ppGpp synthase/HD superfamily hydrolase